MPLSSHFAGCVVGQFQKSMNPEGHEEDLESPVEERRFKRRVVNLCGLQPLWRQWA